MLKLRNLVLTLFLLMNSLDVHSQENALKESFFPSLPSDWTQEFLPFPLDFAPTIPNYKGVEELRFAPGMFSPTAPDYFHYVFMWHLDGMHTFDAAAMRGYMLSYYQGLYKNVSKASDKQKTANADKFDVAFKAEKQNRLSGEIIWLDPFNKDRPLMLIMETYERTCTLDGNQQKTDVLFLIHPKGHATPTWHMMQTLDFPRCW